MEDTKGAALLCRYSEATAQSISSSKVPSPRSQPWTGPSLSSRMKMSIPERTVLCLPVPAWHCPNLLPPKARGPQE